MHIKTQMYALYLLLTDSQYFALLRRLIILKNQYCQTGTEFQFKSKISKNFLKFNKIPEIGIPNFQG